MDIPGYGDALTELVELGDTVLRQPSELWRNFKLQLEASLVVGGYFEA